MNNYHISPTGCWEWDGQRTMAGYGVLSWHQVKKYAHRLWWERHNGVEVPPGMSVCHRCDNPPCVNPEHLFIGTALDNVRDAMAKGRLRPGEHETPRGEQVGTSKLSVLDAGAIRLLLADGMRGREIAEAFGVAETNVSSIKHKHTWIGKSLEVNDVKA